MMQKVQRAALLIFFLFAVFCFSTASAAAAPFAPAALLSAFAPAEAPAPTAEDPAISALSAIVMDRESGRVLWAKDPDSRLPIASTTKIMTALLALELGCEDDTIIAGKKAAETEGSSIWLDAGEKKTLGELLYGLMLRSGNDAAVAIAEHIAGSEEKFVEMMNEKAAALGAVDTLYSNPHGLPDGLHYSTARDLGLITCRALQNERFRRIISTPERTISWPGQPWDRAMSNQNKLLQLYPGGDGVKTGWTIAAGRCFVGSATREGWQLVCVVLNAPEMWEDAVLLLDYGFENYRRHKMFGPGEVICTAPVRKGRERVGVTVTEDLYLPLQPGEEGSLHCRFLLDEKIKAPLSAGAAVGEVEIYLGDNLLRRALLCAAGDVGKKGPAGYFKDLLRILLGGGVKD